MCGAHLKSASVLSGLMLSQIFSSAGIQLGARWQFCKAGSSGCGEAVVSITSATATAASSGSHHLLISSLPNALRLAPCFASCPLQQHPRPGLGSLATCPHPLAPFLVPSTFLASHLQQHPRPCLARCSDQRRRLGPLPLPHRDHRDLQPITHGIRKLKQRCCWIRAR